MKPFLGLILILVTADTAQPIHVNQVGYYQFAKKAATVTDTTVKTFHIIDTLTKEKIFSGVVSARGYDRTAEETAATADFTGLNKTGTFRCVTDAGESSVAFTIHNSCYSEALKAMFKSYYYLRSGISLLQEYAGQWKRGAGHQADSSLTVFDIQRDSIFDVRGGWYDAGDFGKYVVCAGITCGTLLGLYEICPDGIGDSSVNIPESGNKKSDLLDEIKYEIDWMCRMQDSDGGVFFKVGPVEWYGDILPEKDNSERFVIGKSTTSTLDFAAVAAMAGRVYKSYDSLFARECLNRAERAWNWAISNPKVGYPLNTDGTGPYEDGSDKTYRDEFLWALTELAITTEKKVYTDTLEKLILTRTVTAPAWWQNVNNCAFYSLAVNKVLSDSATTFIKEKVISFGDIVVTNIEKSPYRNPLQTNNYTWGSNATCGNYAVGVVYAHYLTGNQKYLDAAIYTSDYLFGRNPLSHCYVSGIGSDPTRYPHHRQSTADKIDEPVPGFVVGGPNKNSDGADEKLTSVIEMGASPAKCYIDDRGSWASNENAINQNAPWILVLAYLEKNANRNIASPIKHTSARSFTGIPKINVVHTKNGMRIFSDNKLSSALVSVHTLDGKCLVRRVMEKEMVFDYRNNKLNGSTVYIITVQNRSGSSPVFRKSFSVLTISK
ncbi:MAG TPA: glycoside hydrolase family 9 protein [Chitinispirillaceae bacterium]|nr:glycoside hydrolase family 9 protein [Chitinispirillaceae bacterium]